MGYFHQFLLSGFKVNYPVNMKNDYLYVFGDIISVP